MFELFMTRFETDHQWSLKHFCTTFNSSPAAIVLLEVSS